MTEEQKPYKDITSSQARWFWFHHLLCVVSDWHYSEIIYSDVKWRRSISHKVVVWMTMSSKNQKRYLTYSMYFANTGCFKTGGKDGFNFECLLLVVFLYLLDIRIITNNVHKGVWALALTIFIYQEARSRVGMKCHSLCLWLNYSRSLHWVLHFSWPYSNG